MAPESLHTPKVSLTHAKNRIWEESAELQGQFFGFEFCSIYRRFTEEISRAFDKFWIWDLKAPKTKCDQAGSLS